VQIFFEMLKTKFSLEVKSTIYYLLISYCSNVLIYQSITLYTSEIVQKAVKLMTLYLEYKTAFWAFEMSQKRDFFCFFCIVLDFINPLTKNQNQYIQIALFYLRRTCIDWFCSLRSQTDENLISGKMIYTKNICCDVPILFLEII